MPPQQPTGGPNQTLLELIYSLKGLAQTVEFFHQDISRKLDEESKARERELDQIRELVGESGQAVSVLPITISDRVEKLMSRLESDIGDKLRDVDDAITDVRNKLEGYSRTAERAISQNEGVVEHEPDSHADITGKIEVTEKGDIRLQVNSKVLKKVWYAFLVLAAGGGAYGIKELIQAIFGG